MVEKRGSSSSSRRSISVHSCTQSFWLLAPMTNQPSEATIAWYGAVILLAVPSGCGGWPVPQ